MNAAFASSTRAGQLLVALILVTCVSVRPMSAADADDVDPGEPQWRYEGDANACAFSPDGKRVLVAGKTEAAVLDAGTGKPVAPPVKFGTATNLAAFSRDGRKLVTAEGGKPEVSVRVWDLATGKQLGPAMRHPDSLFAVTFDPEGTRVVTASMDKAARIWEVGTGTLLHELSHRDAVLSAEFSADGRWVLTVGRSPDDRAYLWDAATGKLAAGPVGSNVTCAALSRDGRRLLTGQDVDGVAIACVWDAGSGKLLARTGRVWPEVRAAAFSPDGARVVTAANGVRVWDAETGKPATRELGHLACSMNSARFTPDGTRVFGTGNGGLAAVWGAATGEEVVAFRGYDAYWFGTVSPDGTRFAAVCRWYDPKFGRDATCLWNIPSTQRK